MNVFIVKKVSEPGRVEQVSSTKKLAIEYIENKWPYAQYDQSANDWYWIRTYDGSLESVYILEMEVDDEI